MKQPSAGCLLLATLAGTTTNIATADLCPRQNTPEANAIQASARYFSGNADGVTRLSGEVQVEQGDNRIRAERIDYDTKTGRIEASGNVHYTNCKGSDPFWFLVADRLTFNKQQSSGTVKDAWLVINNRPLVYLPRYRLLSERERKSGFLSPDVSSSSNNGIELGLPYYFNLAPNHDATLEPRVLGKRGLQLESQYRYLYRFHEGTLEGSWLDDHDSPRNNRYRYSINHLSKAGDRFRVQLQVQRVSDENYIEDLGGSFDLSSRNHLASKMLADYVWRGWHLNLASESFQRIDDSAEPGSNPYEKKPHVGLRKSWHSPVLGVDLGLRSEWVKFNARHSGNDTPSPEGERLDSEIVLSKTYRRPGFYFSPSVAMRYTDYKINNSVDKDRALPWFSLDTGLVFEKQIHRKKYLHTLEPRLFYLNVPYRQQSDLPVFDTGISEFGFSQLFEENRYNGADRIGDTNQLTVALISRVTHSRSGKEAMRLGIGHTSYFNNRKVHLPDEDTSTSRYDYSDLVSEFSLNLNEKIKFTSSLIWDTEEEEPRRYSVGLALNAGEDKIIDLSHRYRRTDEGFNQGRIGFVLPIGTGWIWSGGWRYDLRAGETIGAMAGLFYETCCWSFGIAGERLLQNVEGDDLSIANGSLDYNTRLSLRFNLRGLNNRETRSEHRFLENWIDNYHQ